MEILSSRLVDATNSWGVVRPWTGQMHCKGVATNEGQPTAKEIEAQGNGVPVKGMCQKPTAKACDVEMIQRRQARDKLSCLNMSRFRSPRIMEQLCVVFLSRIE